MSTIASRSAACVSKYKHIVSTSTGVDDSEFYFCGNFVLFFGKWWDWTRGSAEVAGNCIGQKGSDLYKGGSFSTENSDVLQRAAF